MVLIVDEMASAWLKRQWDTGVFINVIFIVAVVVSCCNSTFCVFFLSVSSSCHRKTRQVSQRRCNLHVEKSVVVEKKNVWWKIVSVVNICSGYQWLPV